MKTSFPKAMLGLVMFLASTALGYVAIMLALSGTGRDASLAAAAILLCAATMTWSARSATGDHAWLVRLGAISANFLSMMIAAVASAQAGPASHPFRDIVLGAAALAIVAMVVAGRLSRTRANAD